MFKTSTKRSWFGLKKTEMVERTIFVAKCGNCGNQDIRTTQHRELHCACGEWVPYVEQTATSPEYGQR